MSKNTRKAQVVVAGYDAQSQSINYLLLQTNERRGSFWQNVTGKVEDHEDFVTGALREAIEETSLHPEWIIDFVDLKLTHKFIDQHKRAVTEKSFFILLDRTFQVRLDPSEHQEFKWSKNIKKNDVLYKGNLEALELSKKYLKGKF